MSGISFRLKPEIKTRFIEALRSGEYKQGLGKLRRIDEVRYGVFKLRKRDDVCYCAQGVLADLAVQDGVATWDGDRLVYEDGSSSKTTLSYLIADWALTSEDPYYGFYLSEVSELWRHNDLYKKSFEDIADMIEKSD